MSVSENGSPCNRRTGLPAEFVDDGKIVIIKRREIVVEVVRHPGADRRGCQKRDKQQQNVQPVSPLCPPDKIDICDPPGPIERSERLVNRG